MIVRRTGSSCSEDVSAFPNSWKTATSPFSRCSDGTAGLRRRSTAGNWFTSSTRANSSPLRIPGLTMLPPCPGQPDIRLETRIRPILTNAGNLRQYRLHAKRGATRSWYRRGYLAILGRCLRETGNPCALLTNPEQVARTLECKARVQMLFFSRRGEESFDLRQPAATLLLSWSQDMRSTVSSIAQWAAAALALLIAPYYSIRTWASVVDPDIWCGAIP